jgi:transcriptional regulator with XRE-family HTH domain
VQSPANPLGEFLRASRARVEPADAGLPASGSRRVAGLRREEVAVLAGVSADYYTRLEQGRERHPSAQVVDAIAGALRLDTDGRSHLFRLARLSPRPSPGDSRALVHPALLQLLDAFPAAAAYVLGPALDVLATNRTAAALLAPFDGMRNMIRVLFRHPEARTVFVEWPVVASASVHALRLNASHYPDDPAIPALVAEMLEESAEFRALWAEHDVRGLARAYKVFAHPQFGRIELTYQTFEVRDAPGQQLLVGTAEPGGESVTALALLGALHGVH